MVSPSTGKILYQRAVESTPPTTFAAPRCNRRQTGEEQWHALVLLTISRSFAPACWSYDASANRMHGAADEPRPKPHSRPLDRFPEARDQDEFRPFRDRFAR